MDKEAVPVSPGTAVEAATDKHTNSETGGPLLKDPGSSPPTTAVSAYGTAPKTGSAWRVEKSPKVTADDRIANAKVQHTVVHQTAHLEDGTKSQLAQWLLFNFPRPQRREIFRIVRALIVTWCAVAVCLTQPKAVNIIMTLVLVGLDSFAGGVVANVFSHVYVAAGMVIAICFDLLSQLWLVLFNEANAPDPNPYYRALMIEAWAIFVVWTGSSMQYRLLGTPWAFFFWVIIPFLYVIVGVNSRDIKHVEVRSLFYTFLVPEAVVAALGALGAILLFPEQATEATREDCLLVLRDLRTSFKGELAGEGPDIANAQVFYTGRIRALVMQLISDTKGCMSDVGFFHDHPARMVRVSNALQALARHTDIRAHSEFAVRALDATMEALASVAKEGFSYSSLNYRTREFAGGKGDGGEVGTGSRPKEDLAALRDELEKRKTEICVQRSGSSPLPVPANGIAELASSEQDDFVAYVEYLALEDCQVLLDEVKVMVDARRGQHFCFLGLPGKNEILDPKPKKVKKAKAASEKKEFSFHPGRLISNAIYSIQSILDSNATRFGFKRSLAFFLVSVWAFLPATADYYFENHIVWLLLTLMALMQPTLGSGVLKSIMRLSGTLFGVFWAYIAFLAAGGSTATPHWAATVAVVMWLPVTIVGFYLQIATKHVYAGQLLSITYPIVSYDGTAGSTVDTTKFAGDRAFWITIGVFGCLFIQVMLFPFLASTDVRETHAAVIHAIEGLVRQMHFGDRDSEEPAEATEVEAEKKDSAKHDGMVVKRRSDRILTILRSTQQKLTLCRQGSLVDCVDEPDLDRPWDLNVVRALSITTERVLAQIGYVTDRILHREADGSSYKDFRQQMDQVAELLIWKLHTLASTLLSKKKLPRLPQLSKVRFTPEVMMMSEAGNTAGSKEKMLTAGAFAATYEMLFEVDVLEEIIGRLYGRELMPLEEDAGNGKVFWWGPEMQNVGIFKSEHGALLPRDEDY